MAFHLHLSAAFVAVAPIVSNLYPNERAELRRLAEIERRYREEKLRYLVIHPTQFAAEISDLDAKIDHVCGMCREIEAIARKR